MDAFWTFERTIGSERAASRFAGNAAAMATALLIGGIGAMRAAHWATPVLAFAAGMLAYGAVNSFGWAMHNDAALILPMAVAFASAAWVLALAVRGRS